VLFTSSLLKNTKKILKVNSLEKFFSFFIFLSCKRYLLLKSNIIKHKCLIKFKQINQFYLNLANESYNGFYIEFIFLLCKLQMVIFHLCIGNE